MRFIITTRPQSLDWYIGKTSNISEGQIALEKTLGYFSDYNKFRYNNLARGRGKTEYPNLDTMLITEEGPVDPGYPLVVRVMHHTPHTPVQVSPTLIQGQSAQSILICRLLKIFLSGQIAVVDIDNFRKLSCTKLSLLETFLGLRLY